VTTLGLSGESAPTADVRVGFRTGWLRHIGVVIGGASGMAVVLGGYEVIKARPEQSFALLQAWGPGFLLVLFALSVASKFLDSMAEAAKLSAASSTRMADALTRLVEQSGDQTRETHRLATFAAQESQVIREQLDRHEEKMGALLQTLNVAYEPRRDGRK
jgi:hypothetical protein